MIMVSDDSVHVSINDDTSQSKLESFNIEEISYVSEMSISVI